jgi:hypothetical protein
VSLPEWPVAYAPTQNSQAVAPFRAPDATDLDDGNRRYRRSTTKNIATVSFSVRMTNADFLTFKAWVRDTLVDGTLPFSMSVWTGSAYETRTCQFTQPYQDDPGQGLPAGVQHTVTVSLDVESY